LHAHRVLADITAVNHQSFNASDNFWLPSHV